MTEVCSGSCRNCGLTFRPRQGSFDGKGWLDLLQYQYGEDLRGMTLAQLAELPDADWEQKPPKTSLLRRLGFGAVRHPSQPNFSFDDCPDFFDGKSYIAALTRKYGPALEKLTTEEVAELPTLQPPANNQPGWPRSLSPAETIDLHRHHEQFFQQTTVVFEAEAT